MSSIGSSYSYILVNSTLYDNSVRIYTSTNIHGVDSYRRYAFTINASQVVEITNPISGYMVKVNGVTFRKVFSQMPYSQDFDILNDLLRQRNQDRHEEKKQTSYEHFTSIQTRKADQQRLENIGHQAIYIARLLFLRKGMPLVISRHVVEYIKDDYKPCNHICELNKNCCRCNDKRIIKKGMALTSYYHDGKGNITRMMRHDINYCHSCKAKKTRSDKN